MRRRRELFGDSEGLQTEQISRTLTEGPEADDMCDTSDPARFVFCRSKIVFSKYLHKKNPTRNPLALFFVCVSVCVCVCVCLYVCKRYL